MSRPFFRPLFLARQASANSPRDRSFGTTAPARTGRLSNAVCPDLKIFALGCAPLRRHMGARYCRRSSIRRCLTRCRRTCRPATLKKVPPRVVSGPTLLTGLIHCAKCGGAMTIRTGQGWPLSLLCLFDKGTAGADRLRWHDGANGEARRSGSQASGGMASPTRPAGGYPVCGAGPATGTGNPQTRLRGGPQQASHRNRPAAKATLLTQSRTTLPTSATLTSRIALRRSRQRAIRRRPMRSA